MPVDGYMENPFALRDDDLAKLCAIREALLDPSPRRIGRLDQWGMADIYETYAEVAAYDEFPISMSDGTRIDAALSVPRDRASGQTCPTILMPAPLNRIGRLACVGLLPRWALGGYAVLSYSQRGLAESGGEIQFSGPQDIADASEIIDWLSGHRSVAADRIGCFGASYGAGTGLLLAARDQRIKAVVGTSAWGNLLTSLCENGTRRTKAFEALVALFGEDRCSKEFRAVIEKIRDNDIDDEVREFARLRSPNHYLRAYNDAQTPIMLTTSWHETIFPAPAVVDLFTGLQCPKSLLIQIGDHGNSELPGLLGAVSKPTEMAYRWMDHFLGGNAGDGVAPRFGVRSEYMHNLLSDLSHPDWESCNLPKVRLYLTGASAGRRDAQMTESRPEPGWARPVAATGKETQVVVAPKLVRTGLAERAGLPQVYRTAEIDRDLAAIWTAAPAEHPMRIQGDLDLQLTVTSDQRNTTIVAYLMDSDPVSGEATIITHAPFTLGGGRPSRTAIATFALHPVHYVLAKGRQLQLVIATHDPSYADANTAPAVISIGSPRGAESCLDIPIRALR
ncbi:CocE/NonD family hydrolase [Amycolatopsis sp. NPDC059090]|uniref:CocE/NonD family hydrolase n=1 Tax=unclassified Amycolatopsis TaxID=2618356 RepID=UPI0036735394